MVALFLLALLLQHVLARDTSQDGYIIQKIDSCPDEGYFFKRDLKFNTIEPSCYLCFCQDNGTAICWSRENKRCDKKYYYHTGKRKRENRSRRSPGLSDIFFRDATRDFFNKRIPEQCKPFESSFSEGCPPADWCIGCTVCDCDANGRWDCHVLSFCPDGKGKKQMKKRRSSKIMKRQLSAKKEGEKKITTKTPIKPTRKNVKNINKGRKPQTKQNKVKQINGKQKKQPQKHTNLKVKPKRRAQQKKPKAPVSKKNVSKAKTNCKNQGKSKKLVLKGNKSKDSNANKNDSTAKFAETILKKVMASVEKFINESQKNLTTSKQSKIVKKRSMSKHKKGNLKNSVNIDSNKIKSKILNKKLWKNVSIKKANEKIKINSRRKREISNDQFQEMSNKFRITTTISNPTTEAGYYTYLVDLNENTTKQNLPVTTDENYVLTTHIDEENTTQTNVTITNKLQNSPKVLLNVSNISQISSRINDTSYRTPETCGKICELKKTIGKLFGSSSKRNTTRFKINKVKANSFNTLANLKKVFNKIFLKKKIFKNVTIDGKIPFRKRKVIKALCKNISSCKLNYNNKELQLKLDKLRAESLDILKSVRVIKGLLKLLDINESNASRNKQFTDDDVNKLNVIINDEYRAKYGLLNLTETQQTQINYIKENTLVFIKSVENFSYTLNDIIKILTNGKKRIESHRFYNNARYQESSKINNSNTVSDKLERITNLLTNYNLVQNKFMKRMYDVLATLDHKANTRVDDNLKEVSVDNKRSNCTDTVEIYTKNIFTNLRKLKHLAQRMSSNTRKKRSTIDNDEAVEYLLMLMEYLFKQNKPMYDPPVNDGIDLLIEAIKNAPDIKTIKNKVLSKNNLQRKQSEANVNLRRNNLIEDENNVTLKLLEQKFKPFESNDDDREDFHDYKDLNKYIESTTRANIKEKHVTIRDYDILIKKPNIDHVIENNKLNILHEKEMNKGKDGVKRYEIYIDDTAEDDTPLDTTTTAIELESSTITNNKKPLRTSSPDKNLVNNYEISHSNNNKIKLDWVEETDDNEQDRENITQINEATTQELTTQANEKATRTIKTIHDKYADPVSSMSREEGERRLNNINPENESLKKQMNLLNSLDYGTEKTFVDSDSREDKYNVDSSPLYFV